MQWLQDLDVAAFRFVNGTLSNPFFDQLMPFVSGNIFFAPAIIIVGIVLIWKGREKAILYLVMTGIIVGTGDGLICRTIKHAVARPRPFSVLENVNRPGSKKPAPPKTSLPQAASPSSSQVSAAKTVEQKGTVPANSPGLSLGSMPSAHAANWFAATMVALIYYRRSIFVMLPFALLVSFSRVYNGVHYPSDVLAGAIIGAGHAAAVIWILNSLWNWAGPKWFALAWRKLPSLIMADTKIAK